MTKNQYNNIPVCYCAACKSLHIMVDEYTAEEYCMECGEDLILMTHIDKWLELTKDNKDG